MDRKVYIFGESNNRSYLTPLYDLDQGNAGLPTNRKVYKVINIIINKMIPSDPSGLLDDFFSKGDICG